MEKKKKEGKTKVPRKKATRTKSQKASPSGERVPSKKAPPEEESPDTPVKGEQDAFPIVGIGASAGGLQALEIFFAGLPADCNMAFVIVQHLDPDHKSLMNSLLSKETVLEVKDIRDGMPVERNQVYIKPPGKDVVIKDRTLYLREAREKEGMRLSIDTFFRSLAEDLKEKSVCIILSGASNDGTMGAGLIKGEGGMVIVQEEKQAQYPRMPRSVIDAGLADIILPVEKMPGHLMQLIDHPLMVPGPPEAVREKSDKAVRDILMIVRTQTGRDFTQYKRNTVMRRIQRRMVLNRIHEIEDYRRYMRQNTGEVTDLFKDLTINVTSFFRDADVFQVLLEKGIRPLIERKPADTPIRVWVPGCASGEEAYSLAILMLEAAEEQDKYFEFKVFGTDINTDAIESARNGLFQENIQADVGPDRLKRFFTKRGNEYRIDGRIRELLVFAVHDVIRDPPFSNMDLISCRNLLIYMDTDLQKRVLPVLHYGLKPGGLLLLGTSETVGEALNLFSPLDKAHKIYTYRAVDAEAVPPFRILPRLPDEEMEYEITKEKGGKVLHGQKKEQIRQLVEQAILEKHPGPAVLIDEAANVRYFYGDSGRYLSLPVGDAEFNLFNMVKGEFHFQLSQAVEKVKKSEGVVRVEGVQVRNNDDFLSIDLVCTPLFSKKEKYHYILLEFEENRSKKPDTKKRKRAVEVAKAPDIAELEQRLRVTRQELQATIEELETANEELKSSNEELQANNEELQSTNEELESSKEELQSTNEELETVNAELLKKNENLLEAEDDLNNLFASSEIGTLFLDSGLKIKRFTPAAKEVFNLEEERDIGRSIKDITCNLEYNSLAEDADEVLDRLTRKEIKARGPGGAWYLVRIVPYRSRKNVIEGVIITFLDISRFEKSELNARDSRGFFHATLSAMWDPVLVLEEDLRIFAANRAFYQTFKTTPKETENRPIFELGDRQWDIPELREFLEDIIPLNNEFQGFEVEHDFPGIGLRRMSLSGRKVEQGEERPAMIILSFRDIT